MGTTCSCKSQVYKLWTQRININIQTRLTLGEIVPRIRDESGTFKNRERFSTGLALPFTHKWTNLT